ncbi:MAG: hypothetical protein GF388_05800 [Candidatus Aegiribacteria sp.]|nr:hypothetical protein [Candidatus Aegiribacteria sp.]MBD3294697.1 hypothetical protein [Candidatus Fermentibacteria bacterium]
MNGKRVLLGITGSAAAFKGVVLASILRKRGCEIDGILTGAALEFVTETQLACVTGRPVYSDLFVPQPGDPVPHISLTENIDLFVVVPATADFMARAACGLGDDLLSCCYLACDSQVLMAPSMNTRMWNSPATAANAKTLEKRGVVLAGPVSGTLACGTSGIGRLMEPDEIAECCMKILEGE